MHGLGICCRLFRVAVNPASRGPNSIQQDTNAGTNRVPLWPASLGATHKDQNYERVVPFPSLLWYVGFPPSFVAYLQIGSPSGQIRRDSWQLSIEYLLLEKFVPTHPCILNLQMPKIAVLTSNMLV